LDGGLPLRLVSCVMAAVMSIGSPVAGQTRNPRAYTGPAVGDTVELEPGLVAKYEERAGIKLAKFQVFYVGRTGEHAFKFEAVTHYEDAVQDTTVRREVDLYDDGSGVPQSVGPVLTISMLVHDHRAYAIVRKHMGS